MRFQLLFIIGGLAVFAEQSREVSNLGHASDLMAAPTTKQHIYPRGDVSVLLKILKNKDPAPAPGQRSVTPPCVCHVKKSKQMESGCKCKNYKKKKDRRVSSNEKKKKTYPSSNFFSIPI